MEFRTQIAVAEPPFRIEHGNRILSLGSCFAENISSKLRDAGFRIAANPFGILFNPVSIASAVEILNEGRVFTEKDLVRHNELWHSFDFHGSFSSPEPGTALTKINDAVTVGSEALKDSDRVIFTFGTAWIYELSGQPGRTAANCHKFPAENFNRKRMAVTEIADKFSPLIEGPLCGKKIIFTVSPVRHLKDGFAGNSASKATLILAVEELCRRYKDAFYFPAYEILTDDLRDYRFYAEDMVHPSATAVEYVWQKFAGTFFSAPTGELASRITRLTRAAGHKPFDARSESHRDFRAKMTEEISALERICPEVDLTFHKSVFGHK